MPTSRAVTRGVSTVSRKRATCSANFSVLRYPSIRSRHAASAAAGSGRAFLAAAFSARVASGFACGGSSAMGSPANRSSPS
ncbi:hypothetical protein B4N89_37735 [Embleya scabrispora]|uniref:Uncharacterized protein n=1 Tax=Embleya scabrispora TaxID=159449 RepID=A0A1T3NM62_9ACTN|nr:hypothetical protein B4N89_37735 [Embleya scabrispora]